MMRVILLTLCVLLNCLSGCAGKNPNLSKEQVLENMQKLEEETEAKKAMMPVIPEGYTPPPGILHNMYISQSQPSVRLDMEAALKNDKKIRLSDLTTEISYHHIVSKEESWTPRVEWIKTPKGYLLQTIRGLWLLDADWKMDRMLFKNDVDVTVDGERMFYMNRASILSCYYDESMDLMRLLVEERDPKDERKSNRFIGTIPMDKLFGSTSPLEVKDLENRINAGMDNAIHPIKEGFVTAGYYLEGIYSHNLKGDTLCYFNFGNSTAELKGTVRSAEVNNLYIYNNRLHFRQSYTDKVMCILDEKSAQVTFHIDFGSRQVSRAEGMKVSFDLSEKWLLNDLTETDRYVFIGFSQNYDCPNTRNNKTIKFHQAIYDKQTKELYSFTYTDKLHEPGKIPNDLDKGLDFWPERVLDDKACMMLTGKELKAFLSSDKYNPALFPGGIDPKDILLITIK